MGLSDTLGLRLQTPSSSRHRLGGHKHPPSREDWRWQPLSRRMQHTVPSRFRGWLADRSSLTHRVCALCEEGFEVRVLHQYQRHASRREALTLGVAFFSQLIVREVQLLCGDSPWVFARSLIPCISLRGEHAGLGAMGNRPLGERLFVDPVMQRGEVQYTAMPRGCSAYRRALLGVDTRPDCLWGRRSLFSGARAPLMVMEFFLPTIGVYT